MFADLRDHVAVTLMGWCAKLATKQYQRELATYIQLGMYHAQPLVTGEHWEYEEYEALPSDKWVTLGR